VRLDCRNEHGFDCRATQQRLRALVWWFYADLKAYRRDPAPRRRAAPRARFYRIFRRRTGFATLDRLLDRLYANKDELLRVLDRCRCTPTAPSAICDRT